MNFRIEKLAEHEAERLRRIRLWALRENPEAFGSRYENEVQLSESDWLERLAMPNVATFVAVRPEGDCGIVTLVGSNGPEAAEPPATGALVWQAAVMVSVWLAPEVRGHGVATALVTEAVSQAHRWGVKAISLMVVVGNLPAERLYQRLGFRLSGVSKLPADGSKAAPQREMTLELER